jgi:ring-1,2-phenylacetyl-CoA epoxidase subunit PaaC
MKQQLQDALAKKLLAMGDDELILAYRNGQWTGHAPILEEDIGLANLAQDELGHATVWYSLHEDLTGIDPDRLVYFRNVADFRNVPFVELPKGDFGLTMLRQYLFDVYEQVWLRALSQSTYTPLAEATQKIAIEEIYHLHHSSVWVRRLGLGTAESNQRMQAALDLLWGYVQGLFEMGDGEEGLVNAGIFPHLPTLKAQWLETVIPFLQAANLAIPDPVTIPYNRTQHTDHLTDIVTEMQKVARLDPAATW